MNDLFKENSFAFDLSSLDLTKFSELPTARTIGENYLVFFLDDELFAISSKKVAEATTSLPITALPHTPEWLLGIANLRGEIISVVNTSALLRKRISVAAPKSKFIILRSQIFEFGAAITADRISEIVSLADEEIQFSTDEKMPHIFGKATHKTQTLNLINTEKLLASLRL
jgi:purine-binding chemotaxis protein CheW